MQGISIREFARQEKCSDTLVRRALQQKRLTAFSDGTLDPALIGSAWCTKNVQGANSSHDVRSTGLAASEPKGLSYSEALRIKENYLAMLRRLEYEEKSGSLIELAAVEAIVFEMFRAQRDAWLNWPIKVAPVIADMLGLTDMERLAEALTEQVHRQISELGDAPEHAFDAQR
jgi:hypothetical protein